MVVVDMNDSRSWDEGSRFYERLKDVHDMINFVWWAQGFRYYE